MRVGEASLDVKEIQGELNGLKTGQAIIEKELKSISKTMERFADLLTKQVEQDQKIDSIDDKISVLFKKVESIERDGTKLCAYHNAQFMKYESDCKNKSDIMTAEMNEIKGEIKFKWEEAMRMSSARDQQIRDMDTALTTACTLRDQAINDLKSEVKSDLKAALKEMKEDLKESIEDNKKEFKSSFGIRDKIMIGVGLSTLGQLTAFVFWYIKSGGAG